MRTRENSPAEYCLYLPHLDFTVSTGSKSRTTSGTQARVSCSVRRGPVAVESLVAWEEAVDYEFRPSPESSALFQYVHLLVTAAGLGSFQEIQWLLQNGPNSSAPQRKEVQLAGFFAAVVHGQNAVCEAFLQVLDLTHLPLCTAVKLQRDSYGRDSSESLEEATSLLSPAYERPLVSFNSSADFFAQHAQRCQYLGTLQVLLKYGVKPLQGVGCLLEATAHNLDILAIQLLLQHGLPVNAATSDGSTLLHLIASTEPAPQAQGGDSREMRRKSVQAEPFVCMLLAAGANPVTRNNKKETAIDVCVKGGNMKAIMQDALAPR